MLDGMSGIDVLRGHPQGAALGSCDEHAAALSVSEVGGGECCTLGKSGWITPKSRSAFSERYSPLVLFVTYTTCLVVCSPSLICSRSVPMIWRQSPVTPCILCRVFTRYCRGQLSAFRSSGPLVHVIAPVSAQACLVTPPVIFALDERLVSFPIFS